MRLFDSRWEGPHGIGRFAREVGKRLEGFDRVSLSGSPSGALEPARLTRYLRSQKPELYLSPGYNAPLGEPCPFIFCVHDLNHVVMEGNSSALKRAYYRFVLRPALHRAAVVLTVSEFARNSICEWGALPESQVCNVGNGVSELFVPGPASRREPASPYFLYVGNHKSHKNFDRLLDAFAISRVRDEYFLVSSGVADEALGRRVRALKLEGRVKFVGQLSDSELAELYRGATALVLVSLYEGFGLPLVEAMACGTPVITSNLASMPEVVGDAALVVDPLDVGAIAESLTRMASDAELRSRLRERGLKRARHYSWELTASRVKGAISAHAR
jgi:glycosyltransferase involved in cell wall biosynthesis